MHLSNLNQHVVLKQYYSLYLDPNQYNNGSHRTGNDFEMSSAPERETANNMLERYPHVGISMLEVSVTSQLSSHTVYNLFNIVPGMETCEFNESSGKIRAAPQVMLM